MKTAMIAGAIVAAMFSFNAQAQSTTGGQSGGSTASTGAGYNSGQTVPPASSANSMTTTAVGSGAIGIERNNDQDRKQTSTGSPRGVNKSTDKSSGRSQKMNGTNHSGHTSTSKSAPPK